MLVCITYTSRFILLRTYRVVNIPNKKAKKPRATYPRSKNTPASSCKGIFHIHKKSDLFFCCLNSREEMSAISCSKTISDIFWRSIDCTGILTLSTLSSFVLFYYNFIVYTLSISVKFLLKNNH